VEFALPIVAIVFLFRGPVQGSQSKYSPQSYSFHWFTWITAGAEGRQIAPSVGYSLESISLKYLQSVPPPPDKVWEAIQANTINVIDKTNARIQEA
jgi:hypothetical protein